MLYVIAARVMAFLSWHPWDMLAPAVDNSWQRQHMGVCRFESNNMCGANMQYLPKILYRIRMYMVMVEAKSINDTRKL